MLQRTVVSLTYQHEGPYVDDLLCMYYLPPGFIEPVPAIICAILLFRASSAHIVLQSQWSSQEKSIGNGPRPLFNHRVGVDKYVPAQGPRLRG